MKVIYSGLESSGKSLRLAMKTEELRKRNARWRAVSGKSRPIYSNMKFSEMFERKCEASEVPVKYWQDLSELIEIENADVIMDEVGNYFDARGWGELSLDVRRWLTQAAKSGVEIYGSAQDFAQVDKAFRRLVNELYHIRKVIGSPRPSATKPPVVNVWGLCMVRELEPNGYDEEDFKKRSVFPSFFLIRKQFCDVFNTNQKIVKSKPAPFRHEVRLCELHGNGCNHERVMHL